MISPADNLNPAENETVDFPAIITVTCHLMTLYALQPCEPLATNINRHFKVILNSSASDSLGEWKGVFRQIHAQWGLIAEQHQIASAKNKSQYAVSH
jgi:hypothetical protein